MRNFNWRTLITFCYKKQFDSLTELLTSQRIIQENTFMVGGGERREPTQTKQARFNWEVQGCWQPPGGGARGLGPIRKFFWLCKAYRLA